MSRQADAADEVARLDAELAAELEDINDRWETLGAEIETLEIGLERDDIDVEEVAVVWIPTR